MPGWRGLLRAALALLLAPAIITGVVVLGVLLTQRAEYSHVALPDLVRLLVVTAYPMVLGFAALSVGVAIMPLLFLRRLTVLRLMLWSALVGGAAGAAWMAIWTMTQQFQPTAPPSLTYTVIALASFVIASFVNAGLFGLLAGVRAWPAARSA